MIRIIFSSGIANSLSPTEHFNSRDKEEEVASDRMTVQVARYDESCESVFVGGEHEVMSPKKLQDTWYRSADTMAELSNEVIAEATVSLLEKD